MTQDIAHGILLIRKAGYKSTVCTAESPCSGT